MQKTVGTVVVVGDDELQCELVRCRVDLHDERFDVVAVRDGADALELLTKAATSDQSSNSTAVFLDHSIRGMNEFEFLKELRVDPRLAVTPVVLISGEDDPEAASRAQLLGVEHQFTKEEFNADPSIVSRILRRLRWFR